MERRWVCLDLEAHTSPLSEDGHAGRDRCRQHAGHRLDAVDRLAIEGGVLGSIAQPVDGHRRGEGEQMIGAESKVAVGEREQAADRDAAATEQREREREFRDHERPAQAMAAAGERASCLFECVVGIRARPPATRAPSRTGCRQMRRRRA